MYLKSLLHLIFCHCKQEASIFKSILDSVVSIFWQSTIIYILRYSIYFLWEEKILYLHFSSYVTQEHLRINRKVCFENRSSETNAGSFLRNCNSLLYNVWNYLSPRNINVSNVYVRTGFGTIVSCSRRYRFYSLQSSELIFLRGNWLSYFAEMTRWWRKKGFTEDREKFHAAVAQAAKQLDVNPCNGLSKFTYELARASRLNRTLRVLWLCNVRIKRTYL